jgi:hypothetical protein
LNKFPRKIKTFFDFALKAINLSWRYLLLDLTSTQQKKKKGLQPFWENAIKDRKNIWCLLYRSKPKKSISEKGNLISTAMSQTS